MDFCAGGDLAGALKRLAAPLAEDFVMRWFVQLLLALGHLHGANVLHRDIKPAK